MNVSLDNGGLPPDRASRMRGVFAAHPTVEKVILFGSRAKGNARPASDIDLAFFGPLPDGELGRIDWELDDLLLPWELDLVLFDHIGNPALREHIARVGKVFYTSLEAAA